MTQSIQSASAENLFTTVKQELQKGGALADDPPTVQKLDISPWAVGGGERNATEHTMVRGSLCAADAREGQEQEGSAPEGMNSNPETKASQELTKSLLKQESHSVNPLQQELIYSADANTFLQQTFPARTKSSTKKTKRKSSNALGLSID